LDMFMKQYGTLNTENKKIVQIWGQNLASFPSPETALDTQYIMTVAPNVPTYIYAMFEFDFFSDVLKWLTYMSTQSDTELPYVISVSYGLQFDLPANSYQRRADVEFAKIGLRGRTVIFASGDYGSGCQFGGNTGLPPATTGVPHGTTTVGTQNTKTTFTPTTGHDDTYVESCSDMILDPSYPSTSLYVTAVGASKFLKGSSGPQGAVTLFQSGGGFSFTYPRPTWQDAAVAEYFKEATVLPPSTVYNSSGRGTPDIASLGDEHFEIVVDGHFCAVGGTSASTPPSGAFFSLINDNLLNAGKSQIGPINQFLYQTFASDATAFADIAHGGNLCRFAEFDAEEIESGSTSSSESPESSTVFTGCGFVAGAGWDPVTGLGTPQFQAILNAIN